MANPINYTHREKSVFPSENLACCRLHEDDVMSRKNNPPIILHVCLPLPPPRLKKSRKSLRESLRSSLRGFWPTPQNESKTSLLDTLRVKNHLFFDSGDSLLTRFGGSARTLGDCPGDSPGDSFLTFWAGEGFDSSARRGWSQMYVMFLKGGVLQLPSQNSLTTRFPTSIWLSGNYRGRTKHIKKKHIKNWRGRQHKDLRAQILYVGGVSSPRFCRKRTPT